MSLNNNKKEVVFIKIKNCKDHLIKTKEEFRDLEKKLLHNLMILKFKEINNINKIII